MKTKILSILCIFILFSFIFINNNVFAATYDLSDYERCVGTSTWAIIYSNNDENIYLITTDATYLGWDYQYTWSGSNSNTEFYGATQSITVYIFDYNSSEFVFSSFYNKETFTIGNDFKYIACNKDIIHPDTSSSTVVVFQQTPVPSVVYIAQTTLAKELEGVEMKEPIITTIVGLAKLLIPFLICLIGFWKAWRLLSRILHKS